MDKEASTRRARIVDGRRVEEAPTSTVAGMAGERHSKGTGEHSDRI